MVPPLIKLLKEKEETVKVEDVQALIDKYPDAVKQKNQFGSLPLHIAFQGGASVEVTQLLFQGYPGAVKEKNGGGDLPLHYAVLFGASVEVIQLLIEEYPDAAKVTNHFGSKPLHYAVRHDASVEVIKQLINKYPDAVREKDEYGWLPLHIAADKDASVEVIQLLTPIQEYPESMSSSDYYSSSEKEEDPSFMYKNNYEREVPPLHKLLKEKLYDVEVGDVHALIDKYPDALKDKDISSDLPLHTALSGASDEVIKLLINEYPDALKEKGFYGRCLPLHTAINCRASVEVIQLLISTYPGAVREKDHVENFLPLHYAAAKGASVEVIQLLIKEYPDALKEKDDNGNLPVYDAIGNASVKVIQLLIKEYPDAAKVKNNSGELLLHAAIDKDALMEVTQLLIKEYPDAAKEKDKNGDLPLHAAIEKSASMEVIQLLIKEHPDALKEEDKNGGLPLHNAAANGAWVEVIQLLIKEYPDAVKEKDYEGNLPLHVAIENGVSDAVIQLLMKEYPDAVKKKTKSGQLPLHYAAASGASVEVILQLISEYPDAMKQKDEHREHLPLHVAIAHVAPVEVIQLLIKEYPDAVKERNSFECLPLHIAIENGASDEVIQLLIKEYPDAAKEEGKFEALPLHDAAANGASVEMIMLLVQEYPDAVKKTDTNGRLPLHLAIEKGAPDEVIQLLIKEYPDAAKKKTRFECLPLHYAIYKSASVEVILQLISEYPDAAKEKDTSGRLPLHAAIEKGASMSMASILLILDGHSQAAKERMKDKRLPIEVYLENRDAGDLVLALLKADMPMAIEDGMPVEHCGSWFTCVSSSTTTATAAVRQVLSNDEGGAGYGKYIHALADVRDAEDRTALAAATSGARTEIYEYLLFCRRYKLREGPPEHITGNSVVVRAQDFDEKADYGVIFDKADTDKSGNLDEEELNTISIADSIGLDPDLFLKGSDKKTISKAEFIAICKRQLGDGPREVVIKFMRNKDHWERERKARTDYKLTPKYVVSALRNIPSQTEIAKAVERGDGSLATIEKKFLEGIKPGKYAIIMNAAERNLHQILYQEQPKIEAIRDMLRQVFEAVRHLHDQGLMHGDLKMVNIVRFRIDNKLRLIDLDACARITQVGEVEESYAGAKFSSAILPPEMIERIETKQQLEKFKKYWKAENDKDLYDDKVKPKSYKKRGVLKAHYVVKSFRTKDGQPMHKGLPYDLVRASKSIDAWSLGVLAFTLLTGETLIPSTFVDDCASGAAMHVLYSWGTRPEVQTELFEKIHDKAARDLVSKLLEYESGKRPLLTSF